ncbi:MAG: type II toxin-antitoxin system RelE/ParE family toxin [Bacteroidota bacterium]|nr:type II toxin-antitoxin system RelE/ParE family toxin [Bacteroidota bacterium]MDP4232504.1 type II toxin-antitoxin system RelE/ParE family toxin [Bacteroidota bacterium]MDP4241639.1 type II toxin-antitoxin system RelE/ParE family toxin [Bacteroidota bacterium]MDP4286384.1 type II toxin-antitoxin system RelE/ParE family toxin [Bacteroidota bacterium]
MNFRIISPAKEELAESALFYLHESPQAAFDFEVEVDAALTAIREAPTRYRIHARDIRVKELDRFPFSLYYRTKGEEILILSVAHNTRMPDFWIDRV